MDPDAGLRPRRRRTPGIPSPGCGRASAAVPRPPGMRRASVAETWRGAIGLGFAWGGWGSGLRGASGGAARPARGEGVSANGGGVGLRGGSWWVGPEVVGWFGSVVAEWADLMWLGVECYSTPRV